MHNYEIKILHLQQTYELSLTRCISFIFLVCYSCFNQVCFKINGNINIWKACTNFFVPATKNHQQQKLSLRPENLLETWQKKNSCGFCGKLVSGKSVFKTLHPHSTGSIKEINGSTCGFESYQVLWFVIYKTSCQSLFVFPKKNLSRLKEEK